ncbi:uncharacterized protein LOC130570871 [Triplophysa rosa]|uniref:uncharacterized protein LOC130570871 n=1 Tax=Triplophysa rosa TaxID=992332 RepID=UPI002545D571|nr:uncharacterized protein LOC130570871 [Triplophysa rosa]
MWGLGISGVESLHCGGPSCLLSPRYGSCQARALRELHEGKTDPTLMQELRATTDLALWATKVTMRALGRAMSTLMVHEKLLWPNLAQMSYAEKHPQRTRLARGGLVGDTVEPQFLTVKKQSSHAATRPPRPSSPVHRLLPSSPGPLRRPPALAPPTQAAPLEETAKRRPSPHQQPRRKQKRPSWEDLRGIEATIGPDPSHIAGKSERDGYCPVSPSAGPLRGASAHLLSKREFPLSLGYHSRSQEDRAFSPPVTVQGAWLRLPRLSGWLGKTIRLGYAIHATCPPKFRASYIPQSEARRLPYFGPRSPPFWRRELSSPSHQPRCSTGFTARTSLSPRKAGGCALSWICVF